MTKKKKQRKKPTLQLPWKLIICRPVKDIKLKDSSRRVFSSPFLQLSCSFDRKVWGRKEQPLAKVIKLPGRRWALGLVCHRALLFCIPGLQYSTDNRFVQRLKELEDSAATQKIPLIPSTPEEMSEMLQLCSYVRFKVPQQVQSLSATPLPSLQPHPPKTHMYPPASTVWLHSVCSIVTTCGLPVICQTLCWALW